MAVLLVSKIADVPSRLTDCDPTTAPPRGTAQYLQHEIGVSIFMRFVREKVRL